VNSEAPLAAEVIKRVAHELGADAVGIAPAAPVAARDHFLAWLGAGYAGDMTYLRRYQRERFDPRELLPGARSVIVVGVNYYPRPDDARTAAGPLRVARYAWGTDYHRVLRRMLRRLRRTLLAERPGARGRICVDTAPFADKYWAARAGLGWQGKHTNLVSRQFGSWLVLGSLVLRQAVDRYDSPHADFCGRCTACLDACPTQAFPFAYGLAATRCLSYWTIEAKASRFPPDIASHTAGWVFGCDICLEVCPWNKFQTPHGQPELNRRGAVALLETGRAGSFSPQEFEAAFAGTPLTRPGLKGIRRNIDACRSATNGE
jgi:epoxyqueuosine reductase